MRYLEWELTLRVLLISEEDSDFLRADGVKPYLRTNQTGYLFIIPASASQSLRLIKVTMYALLK